MADQTTRDNLSRALSDKLVSGLLRYGFTIAAENPLDVGADCYRLQRSAPRGSVQGTVTMLIALRDHETRDDVVITNMTTLPQGARCRGLGREAIVDLLEWATANGLHRIRAVQVGNPDSRRFWYARGFRRAPEPNPSEDWVCDPVALAYEERLSAVEILSEDLSKTTRLAERLATVLKDYADTPEWRAEREAALEEWEGGDAVIDAVIARMEEEAC